MTISWPIGHVCREVNRRGRGRGQVPLGVAI